MRSRRSIFAVRAGLAVAAGLPTPGAVADSGGVPVFTHGVASGDVTSSAAVLWTRIDRATNVKVEVWDNPELAGKKSFQRTVPQVSASRDITVKVDATGLEPGTTYYFRFKHDDFDGIAFSEVGTFRTAPPRGSQRTCARPTPATPTARGSRVARPPITTSRCSRPRASRATTSRS